MPSVPIEEQRRKPRGPGRLVIFLERIADVESFFGPEAQAATGAVKDFGVRFRRPFDGGDQNGGKLRGEAVGIEKVSEGRVPVRNDRQRISVPAKRLDRREDVGIDRPGVGAKKMRDELRKAEIGKGAPVEME